MKKIWGMKGVLCLLSLVVACQTMGNDANKDQQNWKKKNKQVVELGPRPFFLIDNMDESHLKTYLQRCEKGPFYKTDFSIGHRGAPLQFPEHTKESYEAAAKMGAGIMECDVTFTKDRELGQL